MKLVPKPISSSDEIDRARDVSGLNKWARSSRTIGLIMLILGWFTIPIEVFFRRDFGQRWFTVINFYAGLLLLLLFSVFQYVINWIWSGIQDLIAAVMGALNPNYIRPDPSLTDSILDHSMSYFLIAYLILSSYHLFKVWWRSRTNTALHSFDDGTSRFEPLAVTLMRPLNRLLQPLVSFYITLIPKEQAVPLNEQQLLKDKAAFTNTVVEPLVLILLGWWLHGIVTVWLWISALALIIHSHWKESARLNKILDFQDSIIEAHVMMEWKHDVDLSKAQAPLMQQAATVIKANPEMAPQMAGQYPDLMSIIDEMNRDGSHLAV